jgi:protoporphyrinogen oxidase
MILAPAPEGIEHVNETIAVVGGGILGMALALRLADAGRSVTLVEGANELGGLAAAWEIGSVRWDKHYHVILSSDLRTRALLARIGLERELAFSEPQTGFYAAGALHPMNGLLDFARFPSLGPIDKLRLGLTILHGSRIKDGLPLEAIPVGTWLRRWSGRRTYEQVWLPLLRAKLGERHEEASAAFIWAIIARLYAARKLGLGRERFGYVPGGYGRILAGLEGALREAGVNVLTSTPVSSIRARGGRIEIASGDECLLFDRAVVTLASTLAERLCDGLNDDERSRLRSKKYQGIVCASLLLDQPLGPYYVTNITDESVPFSAVIDMSAVVDSSAFDGLALVYLPKYVAPDDPLFEAGDDGIERAFLAALERMYPAFRRSAVRAVRISRVREVFPIATLRYSDLLPPLASSVDGLFFANSAHVVNGTLNVNETLGVAERAAQALLETAPR